jgi:hypothetical protein
MTGHRETSRTTSSDLPDLRGKADVRPERRGQATVVSEVEAFTSGLGDEDEGVVDLDGSSPLATQVVDLPDRDFLGRHQRIFVTAGFGHAVSLLGERVLVMSQATGAAASGGRPRVGGLGRSQ